MSNRSQISSDEYDQKAVFDSENTQKELNAPSKDPSGVNSNVSEFMKKILEMVENGKIDLHKPSSLFNEKAYADLGTEGQGKADMEAVNLLSVIREIKDLHDGGFGESFQIQNAVERLKNTKDRLEEDGGDLFII